MPLVTQFDTPASLRDLPAGSPFYTRWHDYVAGSLARVTPGVGGGRFYDPSEIDVTPIAQHTLTWMGFPRQTLLNGTFRDDRRGAFVAVDADRLRLQNEYFEWRVARNADGQITRAVFATETPEYYELLACVDRARLVALYRALVDPAVVEADLFVAARPTAWRPRFEPAAGDFYNRQNHWNVNDGIVHYIQDINTLDAAFGAAQGGVTTNAGARDNYEAAQGPSTSVDPRLAMDMSSLSRKGLSITLREPIGLYIAGWDDTGWTKPNGAPTGNYWRITRGAAGVVLRVEYEVPAAEGFVVGDIRIGGRPIEFGAQMAEHITVKVGGIAGLGGR